MPAKPAKSIPTESPWRWQAVMPGMVIALLVIIAYLPALRGQFIWDDDFHVISSSSMRSLGGLWRIWFVPGATQQYYPLTFSSFWIDSHLWNQHPLPYHVENILLHALNAILVWQLLRRLNVPGAWLGAALFALHPVGVESVAWVAERKNTLSGFFFLLSLFAAIEFWLPTREDARPTESDSGSKFGPWKFYWCALALYLCALCCKTPTAVLPGVILLLAWWKRGWVRAKDWALVLPFLALGLALGLLTASIEHKSVVDAANGNEWNLSLADKFVVAGRALWFYLGKLCWPHPLIFIYPRWVLHSSQPLAYLPLAAALIVFAVLWLKRNTAARPVLVAAAYFTVVLFPALGFFNIFPFRYSFVADHFQYLAAIGPFALAAAGFTWLMSRAKNEVLKPVATGVILTVLGVLSWRHIGIFLNKEVLWRDTFARNPTAWMAHDNLGRYLIEQRRFAEADAEYRKAIEIRPNDHIAYYDLGLKAAIQGNLDEALDNFNHTLDICPSFAMARYQIGNVFVRQNNLDDAIHEYREALKTLPELTMAHFNLANTLVQKGNVDEAIEEYKRALESQPDFAAAHATLGRLLAAKGDIDGAILHYRAALDSDPNSVEALANLANALISKGQLDDAIGCYRAALQLDPNSPVLHQNLSVALRRQGNKTEADAELAEAQRLKALQPAGR